MDPKWRTETVVALCRRMLDLRRYDALPILADALQEAGCDDARLLLECQDPGVDRDEAEKIANQLFSAETAAAVSWLTHVGRHVVTDPYRYRDGEDDPSPAECYLRAIRAGREAFTDGSISFDMDGSNTYGYAPDKLREFFDKWSLVTGIPVPDEVPRTVRVNCNC